MGVKVFCDFDRTVSMNDVGDTLFRAFGGKDVTRIVEEWMQDTINSRECWTRLFRSAPSITRRQLEAFSDTQQIDPHFKEFVLFCEGRGIELYVLSDGFDFYIERILRKYGLEQVRFFANHLNFNGDETIYPTFPYTDSECDKCANCKRNHLLTLSGEDDIIVYVGDGNSDRCPAEYADIVFAKRDLQSYCQSRNISYYEFRTFGDVKERLEKILSQKRVRKRWQAELKRREAFAQG